MIAQEIDPNDPYTWGYFQHFAVYSPTVSPSSVVAGSGIPFVFTAELSRATDTDTIIDYELFWVTRETGETFSGGYGQLSIPAGATTATVEIMPIFPVTSFQKTITMDVIGATTTGSFSAQIAVNSPQTATITASQDPELEVLGWAVSPSIVAEGAGAIVFTTTLSKASIFDVTISYTLAGTTNIGVDFDTPPSILSIDLDGIGVGQFVIPAGATTGTVTIQPLVDDPYPTEYNETVTFQVTGATTALGIVPRPNAPSVTATITPV